MVATSLNNRTARVSSAWKTWTTGNREKPKSEVMSIAEFERRANMDIIGRGNFHVDSIGGKSTLYFELPND